MSSPTCMALSGGVGGAKLVLGLSHTLPADELAICANIGDDFEHLGLTVCPDIDTLVYTLSGLANPETGWGRASDGSQFMDTLKRLGAESWFHLGDADLAMHVARTQRLRSREGLGAVTADISTRLGIDARILPASDDHVRTMVETATGYLPLQQYFVRQKCAPEVTGFLYKGAEDARANPDVLTALSAPALRSVIICPSNPYISIDPILAVPALRQALIDCCAPVVAVSPIVSGDALKGPTAKMMRELGLLVSAITAANHYGGLIDGFVLDPSDEALAPAIADLGIAPHIAPAVMTNLKDKVTLARSCLDFAESLS